MMYYDLFSSAIISFFAIYGFIQIVFYIFDIIFDFKVLRKKTIFTVIGVKNEQAQVEGLLRALEWRMLRTDTGMLNNQILVVDLGSCDDTLQVVEKYIEKDKLIKSVQIEEVCDIMIEGFNKK